VENVSYAGSVGVRVGPAAVDRHPESAWLVETGVGLRPLEGDRRRWRTVSLSILAHAVAIAAIVLAPFLGSQRLPDGKAGGPEVFFVDPSTFAPPPPPPPPRAALVKSTPRKNPEQNRFVAPVEIPDAVKPEAADLAQGAVEDGVPGGVADGVAGGVVGGVIGGIPDAPAPAQPVRVGGDIREPRKLKNVAPEYPERARKAGVEGMVILECVISPAGRVVEVHVLRSLALLDEPAVAAVKQWIYTPTLMGGVAVPVIMTVTVRFGLK
jgi:protein TonB